MPNTMAKSRSSRPANRPSRRHEILQAAIDLLAVRPPDEIAVSDIAAHCGMTPAAFYYHFASKDEILDEIVAEFASAWSEQVAASLATLHSREDISGCIDDVLSWVEQNERAAQVFFVTSVGATSVSETIRRKTRNELARRAARAFRELAPGSDRIQVAIAGLGMVTLLEIACRSRLEDDLSYRTLGDSRFRDTAANLASALIP